MAARKASITRGDELAAMKRGGGRRMSMYRPSLAINSLRGGRAGTDTHSEMSEGTTRGQAKPKYENTYRLGPEEDKLFVSYQVERVMREILDAHLESMDYNAEHASKLSKDLCSHIKIRVKELGFERHKLIAQVYIIQNNDQGVEVASRCLWNHNTDSWAAVSYRNKSLIAQAVLYGVYYD